jgi:hypothetical protein
MDGVVADNAKESAFKPEVSHRAFVGIERKRPKNILATEMNKKEEQDDGEGPEKVWPARPFVIE